MFLISRVEHHADVSANVPEKCIVYSIGVYRRMDERFGIEWNVSAPCPVSVPPTEITVPGNSTSADTLVPVVVPAYAGVVLLPSVCEGGTSGVRVLNATTGDTMRCITVFGSVVSLAAGQSGVWVVVRNDTDVSSQQHRIQQRQNGTRASDFLLLIDWKLGKTIRSVDLGHVFQPDKPPLHQSGPNLATTSHDAFGASDRTYKKLGAGTSVRTLSPITLGQTAYTNARDIAIFAIATYDGKTTSAIQIVCMRDTLQDVLWATPLQSHTENHTAVPNCNAGVESVSQIVLVDSDPVNPRLVVSVGASVYGIG